MVIRTPSLVGWLLFLSWLNLSFAQPISSNKSPSGLSFKLYDNAALAFSPAVSGITQTANLSLAAHSYSTETGCFLSGELSGTALFGGSTAAATTTTAVYKFSCDFTHTSSGFVWIDGHLVCSDGNSFRATDTDNPLPIDTSKPQPFRARITTNDTACQHIASFQLTWKELAKTPASDTEEQPEEYQASKEIDSNEPFEKSSSKVTFSPHLPPAEAQRDEFQKTLGYGWGAWLRHNMVSIVKLPEGIIVTPKLCQISSNTCLEFAIPDDDNIRVGLHTMDRSYVSYRMAFQTANVTVEYSVSSSDNSQLYVLVTSQEFPQNDPFDYEIQIHGRFGWYRPGTVTKTKDTTQNTPQLTFETPGFDTVNVTLTTDDWATIRNNHQHSNQPLDDNDDDHDNAPYLRVLITQPYQPIAFGSNIMDATPTIKDVQTKIKAAKDAAQAALRKRFGDDKYAVAEAVLSTSMWSTIYNPVENNGLLMPISRTEFWDFRGQSGAATTDWTYIIFDWDTLFASLLAGLGSKGIAYSNLFQVVKSKAAAGFIPNIAAGGFKSQDRTEPMIGAKVTLELYRKYKDKWPVEVVFDDLLDWNNWSLAKRSLPPLGLIALGSHEESFQPTIHNRGQSAVSTSQRQLGTLLKSNNTHTKRNGAKTSLGDDGMASARDESGMDNSPMYDGDFWNDTLHVMNLYDVGMSSLFAQEAYSLAELAEAIGKDPKLVQMLRKRGDTIRDKIQTELWDESQQAFVNRFTNGTFYRRVSPTSFYPMMAGAATQEQVESMVGAWLLNSSRFCIAPNGDFDGNDPKGCYWGLPSISADDPAFMAGDNYWRGYVWGPLVQLVHWSLQYPERHLAHLDVKDGNEKRTAKGSMEEPNWDLARKALCKQMEAMMMNQWNRHRDICENFHPSLEGDGAKDCTGTKFYHWGALAGLVGLVEDGYW
ncbi:Trehalase [Seminavis robusta]|uniref:Trehalase n=1 Tax=Seminavis robusta TaxID=568900 RepID=A0A9N8D7A1_9STRA|nr:Trehalase [Seminavis robusta]|eukprot:Sro19_g013590.1 Trehalase (932) ;mRNA; r:133944-137046